MPRGGGREDSDSGYDYRKRKLGVREEEMSSGSFGDASIDDFVVDDYDAAQEEVEGPDGTSSSGAPSGPMWVGGEEERARADTTCARRHRTARLGRPRAAARAGLSL